jgi:hypothetical protein
MKTFISTAMKSFASRSSDYTIIDVNYCVETRIHSVRATTRMLL